MLILSLQRESRWIKYTWVPFVALRWSDTCYLSQSKSALPSGESETFRPKDKLTSRGTPSGSPISMTVCSDFEKEVPAIMSASWHSSFYAAVKEFQAHAIEAAPAHRSYASLKIKKKTGNILKKLGLRSWPYLVFGVAGEEVCCCCRCGVCGELE